MTKYDKIIVIPVIPLISSILWDLYDLWAVEYVESLWNPMESPSGKRSPGPEPMSRILV